MLDVGARVGSVVEVVDGSDAPALIDSDVGVGDVTGAVDAVVGSGAADSPPLQAVINRAADTPATMVPRTCTPASYRRLLRATWEALPSPATGVPYG